MTRLADQWHVDVGDLLEAITLQHVRDYARAGRSMTVLLEQINRGLMMFVPDEDELIGRFR